MIKTLKLILNYNGESSPLGIEKSFAKAPAVVSRIEPRKNNELLCSRMIKIGDHLGARNKVFNAFKNQFERDLTRMLGISNSTGDLVYSRRTHVLHFFRYSSIFVFHHILLPRGTVVLLFHQSFSRIFQGIIHFKFNFYLMQFILKCSKNTFSNFFPKMIGNRNFFKKIYRIDSPVLFLVY